MENCSISPLHLTETGVLCGKSSVQISAPVTKCWVALGTLCGFCENMSWKHFSFILMRNRNALKSQKMLRLNHTPLRVQELPVAPYQTAQQEYALSLGK